MDVPWARSQTVGALRTMEVSNGGENLRDNPSGEMVKVVGVVCTDALVTGFDYWLIRIFRSAVAHLLVSKRLLP